MPNKEIFIYWSNKPKSVVRLENGTFHRWFDWNAYSRCQIFWIMSYKIHWFHCNIVPGFDYVHLPPVGFSFHVHRCRCKTKISSNGHVVSHTGKCNQRCLPYIDAQCEELKLCKQTHQNKKLRRRRFWKLSKFKFCTCIYIENWRCHIK